MSCILVRMAIQITVDLELCQGHGKCYLLAPKVFAPIEDDDWGMAEPIVGPLDDGNDPDGSLRKQAEIGQRACPESAITLTQTAAHEPSHS